MSDHRTYRLQIALLAILVVSASAQTSPRLTLHYADNLEVVPTPEARIWYASGSVVFETESGFIYCDSAIWVQGKRVKLKGSVIIDDEDYRLVADSVDYDQITRQSVARGSYVELWSRTDSLYAVGRHAFSDRDRNYFYMDERPTLYLNYPDTAAMIEVVANFVEFDGDRDRAEAIGEVRISSDQIVSNSGCAVMYPNRNLLDLFDEPVATHRESEVSGSLISVRFRDKVIEPKDTLELAYDESILSGKRLIFDFDEGELYKITCYGQAYSWYYPYDEGKPESSENSVSGDTIRFDIDHQRLLAVHVIGGAIGTYLSSTYSVVETPPDTLTDVLLDTTIISQPGDDSLMVMFPDSIDTVHDTLPVRRVDTVTDTIDYEGVSITYDLDDSLITLRRQAQVKSGNLSLRAYAVQIDTRKDIVRAFSADIVSDSLHDDSALTSYLQPNPIPVILQDVNQTMYGDFLEYSIETEKGRIIQSKSSYDMGLYYGQEVFRETKDVFYMENGRYTTCDAPEPHFHFYSKELKLIEGEKLIAKPVVMHIGRIPILAIPYYVFPLKRGRHSGFLTFTIGNLERGERYLRNVGYYWAASDYWDWLNAIDYYDERSRLNFFSKFTYNKRYVFNGYISGNFARETGFIPSASLETQANRWTLSGAHNHTFSPSFRVDASGSIQSDKSYYQDYSADLPDRLNRTIRSQVNFRKGFGESVSLSGKIAHDDNLDTETRTDQLPSLGLSLPQFRPFGGPKRDDNGELIDKWYHNLVGTYRPNLVNYSRRSLKDSSTIDSFLVVDTLVDTLGDTVFDTTMAADTTTMSLRTRKKYTRINHSLSLSFPVKFFKYVVFNPSASYREEWFKIWETDQSRDKSIDAGRVYRSYLWSLGTSASTKLYGTVYPNVFGLIGLRQVLTPTVSYSFTPELNKYPEIRAYAGGSAGSARQSQNLTFSLNQFYQAKVKRAEGERNLQLVSITSAFSYNLEKQDQPFSDLTTSFQSTVLPKIRFFGSVVHSLYKPGTNELSFFSPYKKSFTLNVNVTLAGRNFLFDDPGARASAQTDTAGVDTPQIGARTMSPVGGGGWNFRADYTYREAGRDAAFAKSSFIRFSLRFKLTPETDIAYNQYYDITKGLTVNNEVQITRRLHCWTGTFYWVPIGSNRGWGFKLYVTALPEIKIDQSQTTLNSGYFQGLGR
jgi:lipopolysaccharide assembly outer membrane protein LptD (OstA)